MIVKTEVSLEVDTDDEDVARQAAEQAVWSYLSFCENRGYTTGQNSVDVHVDGHGRVKVSLT